MTDHRLTMRRAILGKSEATYDIDPTPTGGANYIEAYEPSLPAPEYEEHERRPARPDFAPLPTIVGDAPYSLELGIKLSASGTAGMPPPYADLLKACGLVEEVVEVAEVPVAVHYLGAETGGDFEGSVTLYDNVDGELHKGTGCRGNLTLSFPHGDIPTGQFTFTGNAGVIASEDLPEVTVTAWKDPLIVNKTNTAFTLYGESPVLTKLDLDLGNVVGWKNYANSAQQSRITDQQITGSLGIEARALSEKDWFAVVKSLETGALQLVHGTVAGKKVQLNIGVLQLLAPKYEDVDGILSLTMNIKVINGFALKFL